MVSDCVNAVGGIFAVRWRSKAWICAHCTPLHCKLTVDFAASPQTLLVAMSTHCGYCRDDAPFYNALAAVKPAARVVGVFPNKADDVSQFVRDNHLAFDTLAEADFRALHLAYTPMAVLVDQRGTVLEVWGGKLSKDGEKQVKIALGLNHLIQS